MAVTAIAGMSRITRLGTGRIGYLIVKVMCRIILLRIAVSAGRGIVVSTRIVSKRVGIGVLMLKLRNILRLGFPAHLTGVCLYTLCALGSGSSFNSCVPIMRRQI